MLFDWEQILIHDLMFSRRRPKVKIVWHVTPYGLAGSFRAARSHISLHVTLQIIICV